jgi:hypothetical protein
MMKAAETRFADGVLMTGQGCIMLEADQAVRRVKEG